MYVSFSTACHCESWRILNAVLLVLQNKEFVCRGYDYERLEDFQQRMLGEFPQAIAMQHPNQPDDTILQSDAQCILLSLRGCLPILWRIFCIFCFMSWLNEWYLIKKLFTVVIETLLMLQSQTVRANALCKHFLWTSLLCEYVCLSVRLSVTSLTLGLLDLQIYAVTPVSDISDVPQLERVPERIKSFYRINNVSRFHYDRPFHKGPKDRENEFRVRWASSATLSHLNETLVIKHDTIGFMEWTVLDTVQQTFCMIYLKPSPFDLYSPRYPFSLSSTFGKENSLQKKI